VREKTDWGRTKFVIVTGGVLSGLGKGIATASIGRLLKDGRKIVCIKCDGYLNVDPGTLNPIEHGEVFVLEDGGEVDMDFGHYERFIDINCKSGWSITSGKLFNAVIEKERRGDYLGKTVQIFPHVVQEVKAWWKRVVDAEQPDVLMIEIGGTVGDVDNSWYIDAARQLRKEAGHENVLYVHLTYIPFLDNVGEPKSKPAQRDIALLRAAGISPDVIIARSKHPVPPHIKEKISLYSDVPPEAVISAHDAQTIYEVPLTFAREGLYTLMARHFNLPEVPEMGTWEALVQRIKKPARAITVAICGKYTALEDSYASIREALTHAGAKHDCRVAIKLLETTDIETGKTPVEQAFKGVDGIIVPGGFGSRGIEGKIAAIRYAREHGIPFLGLCYGLQLAIVEYARNVCGLPGAHTTEIDEKTPHPVIAILPEQKAVQQKGGTMRLGACAALIKPGTVLAGLYGGASRCSERHRHRYEVNPAYHDILQKHGMAFSGTSENGRLVEFIELPQHPYFVATQAHNELTSRLERPNPLFDGFVKAAVRRGA
jgi:CTP synthase